MAIALLMPGAFLVQQASNSSLAQDVADDVSTTFYQDDHGTEEARSVSLQSIDQVFSKGQHEELLWLARCIYSETKRPIEQLYVGWVIRNRVESQYRGSTSYREVVLDPYQFSAFIDGTYKNRYYSSLTLNTRAPGWQQALHIARYVMLAPPSQRPFSILTRHFYSARSMGTSPAPQWSRNLHPVPMREHQIDANRFQFFAGVL